MEYDKTPDRKLLLGDMTDLMIRIGIIAVLAFLSVRIVTPFLGLVLWGVFLGVTLYPVHQRLAAKLGGRQGNAATLLVLAGLLLIGGPVVILGVSFADQVSDAHSAFANNTIQIPPPKASVESWPLVGEELYRTWLLASQDLPALLEEMGPRLAGISKKVAKLKPLGVIKG